MSTSKSPNDSLVQSRKLVMPDQINPNGALFGGVLMSWIDKVAYMSAQRHSGRSHVVTVNIEQIHFKTPLKVGDHAILVASVEYVGRTSMEIGVTVEQEDPGTGKKTYAASAALTFVALNENGKPVEVPRLIPMTDEDHSRYDRTQARVKIRGRLRNWLQERFPLVGRSSQFSESMN